MIRSTPGCWELARSLNQLPEITVWTEEACGGLDKELFFST
jgi:hypothetical protein